MRSALHQSVFLSFVLSMLGCGATDPPPQPLPLPIPVPNAESPQTKLLVAGDEPGGEGARGVEMVAPPMIAADGDTSARVAYYRFDESEGPVLDSSGHGHHGKATDVIRG